MQESYKETAMLQHWNGSPESMNDTYLQRRNRNIIKLLVIIIIIIMIEYISIIH